MVFNRRNPFDNLEHEALMGVWWSGLMLKQLARKFFKKRKITESEFNILMALKYAEKRMTQQELCERLLVDKSNLTGLLDQLEERGFVQREKTKEDRRSYRLILTGEGKLFLENEEFLYRKLIRSLRFFICWQNINFQQEAIR